MGYREFVSRETKQQLQSERDSLLNESKQLQIEQEITTAHILELEEQIAAQDLVIQSRELEVISTMETANKYRKQYESVKRLHFTSNAQRDSILSVLYPSR